MARFLVLDSEAIDALARASERGASAKRAQVVLAAAYRASAFMRVPGAVLVEVYRGTRRDAALDGFLNRIARVVPTGRSIARLAGGLLHQTRLDSAKAVDAIVVATAVRLGGAVIATHDPRDIGKLSQRFPNVKVLSI